jgi:ribose transport system substrate-binding protein
MFKRVLLALFVVALLVPMAVMPAAAQGPTKANPADVYYWIVQNPEVSFYVEGKNGWFGAAKYWGVPEANAKFVGVGPGDVAGQVALMEQAIADPNCAGIMQYATDQAASEPVLRKAMAKGITVINGNFDTEDKTARTAFIGTANTFLGETAARMINTTLNGKGKVGIISYIQQFVHQQRMEGCKTGLKAYSGIELVGTAASDGTPKGAYDATTAFVQAHPDVNLLWGSDGGSYGIYQAIEALGLQDKIKVIGTDRPVEMLELIKAKKMLGTIAQDTTTEEFMGFSYMFLRRNNVLTNLPDTTVTNMVVIDQNNIDQYYTGK